MTAPKGLNRSLATLKLPKGVPAIVAHAQGILACMTDNPHFPAPVPPLWVIGKALTDLEKAEAAVLTRTKGTAAIRNEQRMKVGSLLQQLRVYVQVVADGDLENGTSIIESAGMTVRKAGRRPPRVFSAKPGTVSGEVKVFAPKAANRAAYDWEYSTDDGVTWLTMPSTIRASTALVGLTPGTTVMFTYRSVTKRGPSHWAAAITATVK